MASGSGWNLWVQCSLGLVRVRSVCTWANPYFLFIKKNVFHYMISPSRMRTFVARRVGGPPAPYPGNATVYNAYFTLFWRKTKFVVFRRFHLTAPVSRNQYL